MVDVFGFCRYKTKTGFVRVAAQKLSEEQAEKSKKRRQRKASKMILLQLIIWVIAERQAYLCECYLKEKILPPCNAKSK